MDRRTTLCMILAGAIGMYSNDIGAVFRIANDAREYFRAETNRNSETEESEPKRLYENPETKKSTKRGFQPTPENIENVKWLYSSDRAKTVFHQGLARVIGNIEGSDDASVRCDTMHHLQDTFYSSAFGIGDPEWIGGQLLGDRVMDEDRAQRIYHHSLSFHGQGRYVEGDVCLKKFVDEAENARAREASRCRTWGDVAVKYLGARPASGCRGLSAEQREIGRYRWRR